MRSRFRHAQNQGRALRAPFPAFTEHESTIVVLKVEREPGRDRRRLGRSTLIAHEYEESGGISHDQVVERVAETALPIGESARRILRSIAEGEKRQR
jgi:hypothetical protein